GVTPGQPNVEGRSERTSRSSLHTGDPSYPTVCGPENSATHLDVQPANAGPSQERHDAPKHAPQISSQRPQGALRSHGAVRARPRRHPSFHAGAAKEPSEIRCTRKSSSTPPRTRFGSRSWKIRSWSNSSSSVPKASVSSATSTRVS